MACHCGDGALRDFVGVFGGQSVSQSRGRSGSRCSRGGRAFAFVAAGAFGGRSVDRSAHGEAWFDGRVDFAPKVVDFAAQGFPLMGGRLDVLNGKLVAALVYGRRKHIVNLFVTPEGSTAFVSGVGERQGYRWLAWQAGGFDYVAVTDASA